MKERHETTDGDRIKQTQTGEKAWPDYDAFRGKICVALAVVIELVESDTRGLVDALISPREIVICGGEAKERTCQSPQRDYRILIPAATTSGTLGYNLAMLFGTLLLLGVCTLPFSTKNNTLTLGRVHLLTVNHSSP